jgi:hypothetical protein
VPTRTIPWTRSCLPPAWSPSLEPELAPLIKYNYKNVLRIAFEPVKRARTLLERGLDFQRANQAFDDFHLTRQDGCRDYLEQRFLRLLARWTNGS